MLRRVYTHSEVLNILRVPGPWLSFLGQANLTPATKSTRSRVCGLPVSASFPRSIHYLYCILFSDKQCSVIQPNSQFYVPWFDFAVGIQRRYHLSNIQRLLRIFCNTLC